MPRGLICFLATVSLAVFLIGCGSLAVPKQDYDAVTEEKDRLADEKVQLIRKVKAAEAAKKTAEARAEAAEQNVINAQFGIFHQKKVADKLPEEFPTNPFTGGIVLEQEILFDLGKTELKPQAKEKLKRLAKKVLNTPEHIKHYVRIDGHSDATPVRSTSAANIDNWWLSAKRAHAVMRALLELGVAKERLYIVGHGPTVPVEFRTKSARNRRVEIIVTRKKFNRGAEERTAIEEGR